MRPPALNSHSEDAFPLGRLLTGLFSSPPSGDREDIWALGSVGAESMVIGVNEHQQYRNSENKGLDLKYLNTL